MYEPTKGPLTRVFISGEGGRAPGQAAQYNVTTRSSKRTLASADFGLHRSISATSIPGANGFYPAGPEHRPPLPPECRTRGRGLPLRCCACSQAHARVSVDDNIHASSSWEGVATQGGRHHDPRAHAGGGSGNSLRQATATASRCCSCCCRALQCEQRHGLSR